MAHLTPTGFLSIGNASLEYKWLAPQSADAPTIVMLHEGLGSVGLWGDFPEKLREATSAGIFVYSRAGYGQSSKVALPRPLDYMQREALDVLPKDSPTFCDAWAVPLAWTVSATVVRVTFAVRYVGLLVEPEAVATTRPRLVARISRSPAKMGAATIS